MNAAEIKEIILKVNGDQAEQEIKRIKKAPLPADPKGELNTGEWKNNYQWHEGDKTHPEPITETEINGTE